MNKPEDILFEKAQSKHSWVAKLAASKYAQQQKRDRENPDVIKRTEAPDGN